MNMWVSESEKMKGADFYSCVAMVRMDGVSYKWKRYVLHFISKSITTSFYVVKVEMRSGQG